MGKEPSRQRYAFILLFLFTVAVCRGQGDLVFENVEAALDLPRVLFAVQRGPRGPLLMPKTGFAVHYAFLDTGASGILMSRETVTQLGMTIDRRARFVDVGVGGTEHFGVSEPLYLGLANVHTENPQDPRACRMVGRAAQPGGRHHWHARSEGQDRGIGHCGHQQAGLLRRHTLAAEGTRHTGHSHGSGSPFSTVQQSTESREHSSAARDGTESGDR